MELTERNVRVDKKRAKMKKPKGGKMPAGVSPNSPPLSPTSPSDCGLHRASESYSPRHDGEIRIHTGDILINVKDLGNGWSLGKNVTRDTLGIFPSSIAMPVTTVTAVTSPTPNPVSPSRAAPPPPPGTTNTGTSQRPTPTRSRPRSSSSLERQLEAVPTEHDPGCPNSQHHHHHHHHHQQHHPRSASQPPPECPHTSPLCLGYMSSTPDESPGTPDSDGLPLPPPPPPLTNTLAHGPGVCESENDCAVSDMDQSSLPNNRSKPHMVVKPNQGACNTFPHRSTSMERNNSEEDLTASCTGSRRPPPAPKKSAPPIMHRRRVANEPEYGNVASVSAAQSGESIASCSHQRAPSARSASCAASVADDMCQGAERHNEENEIMQCPSEHRERFADIKRTYYRDYRTMDSPQTTVPEAPVSGYATHPQPQFKSILKNRHQKVGDSKTHHVHTREQKQSPSKTSLLVLAIIGGLFYGGLLYMWMYYVMLYSWLVSAIASGITALIMCITFALWRQARTCAAILLPSVCTTRGRIAFLVVMTGVLLGGPVTTLHTNINIVSESMTCSAEQTYSQAMMILKPFDSMVSQLNSTVSKLQQASSDVVYRLEPLTNRLSRVESNIENGRIQLKGTKKTCREMVDRAYAACTTGIMSAHQQCEMMRQALRQAYHNAYTVLQTINPDRLGPPEDHLVLQKRQAQSRPTVSNEGITDICHPLATLSVCNGLNNSLNTCQPSAWAGEAIQEAINHTRDAMKGLQGMLEFTFDSEPYFRSRAGATINLGQIQKKVQAEIEQKTEYFRWVTLILARIIFPSAILILIYVSYIHIKKYMSRDTYDNIYVTHSFRDLDERRATVAGETLLPLKPIEKNYLVDTSTAQLSRPERGICTIGLCVFFLHFLVTLACYMFDYILYWLLALIEKHARTELDVTGYDILDLVVPGEGFIPDLLNIFLKTFHPSHWSYLPDARDCLPVPVKPALAPLIILAVMYHFLLFTIILKAYILRVRNMLTGYFYPERHKTRTVHLYNVILNQRARMPALLHQKVKIHRRELEREERMSFCKQLASICSLGLPFKLKPSPYCLLCSSIRHPTYFCGGDQCGGVYCSQCYDDLNRQCPLCHSLDKDDDDYEEMEDDLTPYKRSSQVYR